MKKWYAILALVLVLSLLLAACGTSEPETTTPTKPAAPSTPSEPAKPATPSADEPQYGGSWKVILTGARSAIGSLGAPHENTGGMYPRVGRPAVECLWYYDGQEKFNGKLAESWDVTADGKTMDVHLRKGVKFHDGTPFNAAAVVENFNLIRDSQTNTTYAANLYKNVTGWEAVDEYTLRVNFSAFDMKFMFNMAERGFVSPTACAKATTPENMAKDHMVGTGPFKYVDHEQAQFIKYTKNENYWEEGKPYVDEFLIDEVADGVTAILAFKKGEAPLIFGITPKDTADLTASGFDIIRSSTNMVMSVLPSGGNPDSVWSNLEVRKAAEYAINKEELAKLGKGYFNPVTQYANPQDARYVKELVPRNYDPDKAKALLAEAGYPDGFKSKLIADPSYNKEVLVALQTYLGEVGIDCELDIVDRGKSAQIRTEGWDDGIVCLGIPFIGNISAAFSCFGPGYYPTMYKDGYDEILEATNQEPDYNKRMALMQKLMTKMYEDAMGIPLWAAPDLSAIDSKKLKGDIQWSVGHPNFYEPQNGWLAK